MKTAIKIIAFTLSLALLAACGDAAPVSDEEELSDVVTYSFEAGDFVTNVRDSHMMLNCAIKIDLISQRLSETLADRGHVVKDVILRKLRQLTEDDLKKPDIESTLSETLVEALNESMNTRGFYRVYFVRFVYQ